MEQRKNQQEQEHRGTNNQDEKQKEKQKTTGETQKQVRKETRVVSGTKTNRSPQQTTNKGNMKNERMDNKQRRIYVTILHMENLKNIFKH